jgi:hypothetical protein
MSIVAFIRALAEWAASSGSAPPIGDRHEEVLFQECNEHLRETERRFHQTFLVAITAGVAIVALAERPLTLDQDSAFLWFSTAGFLFVCVTYMCILLHWKTIYHRRIRRFIREWRIPSEMNPFEAGGRGADRLLLGFAALMSLLALGLGAYSSANAVPPTPASSGAP